ncbi:telomere-capping, CST complex subunit-domain-containing protein [Polychytrium aggregatum]|uniref:telomere-capping, CST complex subunit-domain-containing protein n=1 Tax=Polychytrium aggregatum TaxID=110093 RepID=UPI0022FE0A0E|nr:telomere-capping, CST complex subunit-domain-containing protein [Polychytrium aggregatum]KAI9208518.1 telomere-capping, CST complex subunit-domain-containing protein [Polychytrium aggregatum]
MNTPRQAAQIVHIDEIAQRLDELAGQSVRVVGRISKIDPMSNLLVLERRTATLTVRTDLVGDAAPLRERMLIQVIGNLEMGTHCTAHVDAKIIRNVDGLDLDLWESAVEMRRRFLMQEEQELAA